MTTAAVGSGGIGNDDREFYAPLRRAGMPIWFLWMKPLPDDYRVAERLFAFAAEVGATGVCMNPEVEWKDRFDEAEVFTTQVRALADAAGVTLGLSAYSRPDQHRDYPWEVFSAQMPLGMPLCFDKHNRFDPGEFTRAAKTYREVGFKTIIPWGSIWAYDAHAPKTPAQVVQHLETIPPTPGIVFWNGGLQSADARAAVDVVRGWSPRPVVPLVARALLGPLAPTLFGG
jgi:hypothetical protein